MMNKYKKEIKPIFEVAILCLLIFCVSFCIKRPGISDWEMFWRPATLAMLGGHNPHDVAGHYAPVWSLFPLVPLALLPMRVGLALMSGLAIGVYYFSARKLGASIIVAGIMVSNPAWLIFSLMNPNIDWMVALGYALPASLPTALLLVTKPQLGLGAFAVDALSNKRRALAVCGAFALTILLYGPYFLKWTNPMGSDLNASLFPCTLPIGAGLLAAAFVFKNRGLALVAIPLMSPYISYSSLPVVLLALLPRHGRIAAAISIAVTVGVVVWGILA